ncbi:15874_t:CDS:2 [Entrophospora sp. SA101]|nr:9370_t:CDS:2 [Entrophospora sp. SA101]CAJ0635078.1 15874_t:CDS:2 [Entrophospora sp. SA101]CAJ0826805.1 10246_t:CDS:2 [Entrophospora sp. SA101]
MPKCSARIQNKTPQTTPPAHTGNNKVTKPTKGKAAPHALKDKDKSSSPDIAMEEETDQEQAP